MLGFLDNKIKNENSCYRLFLSFKTLTNILGLIRGTAFGYLLHKLNVSPFYLSLFFIISIFSNVFCYFLFPFLSKKFNNSLKTIIAFELLCSLFLIISTAYLFFIYSQNSFGSYWVLIFLNMLLFIPVYGFVSASPLFVKDNFPKLNYNTIIRFDFLSFSVAKLFGFSLGALIIDIKYIICLFIISFLYSVFLHFFYKQILLVNNIKKEEKTHSLNTNVSFTDTYYNPILTYLMVLIPTIFLVIINVQSVFLDKTYGIPFYIFPLVGSMGGLCFNLFFNKKLSLNAGRKFYTLGLILCFSFLTFAFAENKIIILFSVFFIGGIYTTLNTICTSRIYSYSKTREPQSISKYYMSLAVFNVTGTFIIGILFEFFTVKNVFIFWSILLFLMFALISILNKIFQLDILKKENHV